MYLGGYFDSVIVVVMKRIMIIGPGNSGKSTLAVKLGKKLDLPVYHLDQYFWLSNWEPKEKGEWETDHLRLIKQDSWIVEGAFSSLYDIRAKHADTIIFMNLPRRIIIPRWVLRRIKYRGKTRPDMAEGNIEKLSMGYLKWLYSYNRKRAIDLLEKYQDAKNTFNLKSKKDIRKFLDQV